MSLLTIIQDASDRIGLPEVKQVIGNTATTERALLGAFIAEGQDLLQEDPAWATLIAEHTFDTQDGVEEYALPDDYQRMITNTAWDRAQFWQIRGGITPQQWQVIRSGLYQTARLSANFRIKQASFGPGTGVTSITKAFFLDPIPGGVRQLVFEYQSKWWIYAPTEAGSVTRKPRPDSDTDQVVFDDELMTRGVIWRFLEMRNLPFATQIADYRNYRNRAIAQDRSPPALTVHEQPWRLPIGNIPDTGFGIT